MLLLGQHWVLRLLDTPKLLLQLVLLLLLLLLLPASIIRRGCLRHRRHRALPRLGARAVAVGSLQLLVLPLATRTLALLAPVALPAAPPLPSRRPCLLLLL